MARRDEENTGIANLEAELKKTQLILWITLAIAGLSLCIILGLSIASFLEEAKASEANLQKVEAQMATLNANAQAWQKRIDGMTLLLDSSQATTFKALMLEQEQSYQQHLNALKNGMTDLARMVPGSRTWLEIYDEKMNDALEKSKARMDKLSRMQTYKQAVIEPMNVPVQPRPIEVLN